LEILKFTGCVGDLFYEMGEGEGEDTEKAKVLPGNFSPRLKTANGEYFKRVRGDYLGRGHLAGQVLIGEIKRKFSLQKGEKT